MGAEIKVLQLSEDKSLTSKIHILLLPFEKNSSK